MAIRKAINTLTQPGALTIKAALIIGWSLQLLLAVIDHQLGYMVRLHALYVFPLAIIALHSANRTITLGCAALISALQWLVLHSYAQPLEATFASWSVATLVLGLVVMLSWKIRQDHLELVQLANRDALTQLFNRREFMLRLEQAIDRLSRYGGCFSLVMLDLDHFKKLNDSRGHAAGDHTLQLVAEALRQHSRSTDICARLGGDEFIILLPDNNAAECQTYCNKLCENIRRQMQTAGYEVTASIGARAFDSPPESAKIAIADADHALYQAKQRGRDCVVAIA